MQKLSNSKTVSLEVDKNTETVISGFANLSASLCGISRNVGTFCLGIFYPLKQICICSHIHGLLENARTLSCGLESFCADDKSFRHFAF